MDDEDLTELAPIAEEDEDETLSERYTMKVKDAEKVNFYPPFLYHLLNKYLIFFLILGN